MKQYLIYLAIRLSVGMVGLLPSRVAQRGGELIGRLWHRFDESRRRMATRHMARALGPGDDPEKASREVLASYGRYWAETLWVRARRVPAMLAKTEVEGLDLILAARDEGNGMIYALPHMGNWEAAAPIAMVEGISVVAVAENLSNRRVREWFTAKRAEYGIEIVLATGGIEVMRRLEAALDANKAVALPSDRDLSGRGVEVEFFGEVTTMPPGPATLAIRKGAPLFPVVSYFEGDGYRILIRPPIPVPASGSRKEKVAAMTQELARHFEEFISRRPEQWHLVVPNWPSDRLPA